MEDNPYQLTDQKILEPPTTLTGKLRYLGPSFILSASIVGSGELFATTLLGAKAGFICLWVILFSCLVKVTIQLEFGKHAIYTGRTTMQALNDLPGPRLGKGHISIWAWLLIMSLKFLQVGGIVGGVALIFMQIPALAEFGLAWWTFFTALAVAIVVSVGRYGLLERLSLIMIGLFTIFTLVSVLALQWTGNAVSGAELLSGLNLQLPAAMILFAVGAFGITGVGGDEIMAYNYWLLEKGYAAHTGPRPGWTTGEAHRVWVKRARGWIKVMTLDAIAAMVCYTLVTVLFYILGAAILHRNGLLPEKNDMITQLGAIYTESLGPWAFGIFLGGALVVLFSTLFSALAAWTRLFSDAFSQLGWGGLPRPGEPPKVREGLRLCVPLHLGHPLPHLSGTRSHGHYRRSCHLLHSSHRGLCRDHHAPQVGSPRTWGREALQDRFCPEFSRHPYGSRHHRGQGSGVDWLKKENSFPTTSTPGAGPPG